MIQLRCPACTASFDFDEKRLPAKGLRMKCPKCGASFRAFPDGRTEEEGGSPGAASKAGPAPSFLNFGEIEDLPTPSGQKGQGSAHTRGAERLDDLLPVPKDALDLPAPRSALRQGVASKPLGGEALPPIGVAPKGLKELELDPLLPTPKQEPAASKASGRAPTLTGGATPFDALLGDRVPLDDELPRPKSRRSDFTTSPKDSFDGDLPIPKVKPELTMPNGGEALSLELDLPSPKRAIAPSTDVERERRSERAKIGEELDLLVPKPASSSNPGAIGEGSMGELELDLPPPRRTTMQGKLKTKESPSSGFGSLDLDLPPPRKVKVPDIGASPSSGLESKAFDLPLPELPDGPSALSGEGELELPEGGDVELVEATQDRGPQQQVESPERLKAAQDKVRKAAIVVGLLVSALVLAGGSLALTPYGPFGYHAFEEWLYSGDPAQVQAAIREADELMLRDDPESAKAAVVRLGTVRRDAGLNRGLLARSLLHESIYKLRFGDGLGSAARASAIRKRLELRERDPAAMALALAADQLRQGNANGALDKLQRLERGGADPFVDWVRGEALLALGKLAEAQAAFEAARSKGGGAAAAWGLARSLGERWKAAEGSEAQNLKHSYHQTLEQVLQINPRHVDARLALALLLWQEGKGEEAGKSLREVVGELPVEGRPLAATPKQKAQAMVWLGQIEETEGRLSQALAAYEKAHGLDPSQVEAVLGAGRMFLSQKRYSEALTRFEAVIAREDAAEVRALSGRSALEEALLGAARALIELGRASDAKAHLERLVASRPEDSEALVQLGRVEEALGNREGAEFHYREAIRVDPKRFEGYLALAKMYIAQNRDSDAQAVLESARSHVMEDASMRLQLGRLELERGHLEGALREFERAAELVPDFPEARFMFGVALRRSGRLEEAAREFEATAAIDPNYPGLALERGMLFESRGQAEQAVAFYERALKEQPEDPELLLRLGAAYVASGQYDSAQEVLSRAQKGRAASAEIEYLMGRIDFARGQFPQALRRFERAIQLDGKPPEFHLYAAWAALENGQLGESKSHLDAVMARDRSLGDAYWLRGRILLRMGAVRDALEDFRRARELNPSRIEALAGMAECHDQLRQILQAIAAYEQALSLAPDRAEWWYRLGRLALDAGRVQDSARALSRAIALAEAAPSDPPWLADAHRTIGEAQKFLGNREAAVEHYKHYLRLAPQGAVDRIDVIRELRSLGVSIE
ncbi:MAG: zinc-ribbon domain-containing protein [Sandaracinaceae bacterium]|nr:zinc-ribbon domain-containing protein [Sandaracinaceae bacterium]